MMSHKGRLIGRTLLFGAVIGVLAAGLSGCGKEDKPQPQVQKTAPPPPPAPPKPKVTPVETLMAQMGIDDRVVLPESEAPQDDDDRRALLTFFDAMVRGDRKTVSEMIPMTDREQLDAMVDAGQWDRATDKVEMVELRTGTGPAGDDVVLALYTVGLEFQPQMWRYGSDRQGYLFEAVPGPPNILDKIAGTDLIQAWFDYLDHELALADRPDELFTIKANLTKKGDDSSASSGGGAPSGPLAPGGPGGPGGRRPIPKTPRKPPGPF